MNKYQEALKRLESHISDYKIINNHIAEVDKESDLELIKELVDRETPLKPIMRVPSIFGLQIPVPCCPMCLIRVGDKQRRCDCGQRISWKNHNE